MQGSASGHVSPTLPLRSLLALVTPGQCSGHKEGQVAPRGPLVACGVAAATAAVMCRDMGPLGTLLSAKPGNPRLPGAL